MVKQFAAIALACASASFRPVAGYSNLSNRESHEPRLQSLVGSWVVTRSTFGGVERDNPPRFDAVAAASGSAVYSVWRQGQGSTAYEANALWTYHSASGKVRVLEANSLGAADLHIGAFDSSSVLTLELRSALTNAVVQSRRFEWAGDTLTMTAQFTVNGTETRHEAVLVRR